MTPEVWVAVAALAVALVGGLVSYFQLSTARKDLVLTHRPWITVVQAQRAPFVIGQKVAVAIAVRNHGSTPALQVKNVVTISFSTDHRPPPTPREDDLQELPEVTIGPGEQQHVPLTTTATTITPERIVAFNAGQATLFVRGLVVYADVFGERHKTEFCLRSSATASDLNMNSCGSGTTSVD